MTSTLIAISGPAATGKSSLARELSQEYGWPVYSKDFFKDPFYEILGYPKSIEDHALLGRLAHECMDRVAEEALRNNKSVIIEGPLADANYRPYFERLRSKYATQILQIQLVCDGETLLKRWIEREKSGATHPGNQGLKFLDKMKPQLLIGRLPKIQFDSPILEVVTTRWEENHFASVLSWVGAQIDRPIDP